MEQSIDMEQLKEKINDIIKKYYYEDVDEMWNKIDALLKREVSPDYKRIYLSQYMEIYAELLVSKKEDEVYLLEIDVEDGARITEIKHNNDLFNYLLNFDEWEMIEE